MTQEKLENINGMLDWLTQTVKMNETEIKQLWGTENKEEAILNIIKAIKQKINEKK